MTRLRVFLAQRRLARMLRQNKAAAERYRRNRAAQLNRKAV